MPVVKNTGKERSGVTSTGVSVALTVTSWHRGRSEIISRSIISTSVISNTVNPSTIIAIRRLNSLVGSHCEVRTGQLFSTV